MEVLRYENVDISYNGVRVVRDISFSVREGEILGIAGESGSGKSTLIRAAMGLLGDTGLVTRGDIRYRTGAAGTATQDGTRFIPGDCERQLGSIPGPGGSTFLTCPPRNCGN